MPVATTPLPVPTKILRNSAKSAKFSEIASQFGDGYKQVSPKGINNKSDNWSIIWGGVTTAEKLEIETALDTLGSWGILSWIPNYEVATKYFRVSKGGYSLISHSNNVHSISCKLEQCFDVW